MFYNNDESIKFCKCLILKLFLSKNNIYTLKKWRKHMYDYEYVDEKKQIFCFESLHKT